MPSSNGRSPDDRNAGGRNGDDRDRKPTLGPTRPSTLFVAGLVTAAIAWLAISRFYGQFPDVPWLPSFVLVALAGLEFVAAVNTKQRIDRRDGAPPVDPLLVARYVVLAKASALAAALFTGYYGGVTAWLVTEQQNSNAQADLPPAAVGLAGSVALIVAALLLERACRVPPPPPSSDPAGPGWVDRKEEPSDTQEAELSALAPPVRAIRRC
jgi:hypothetical protein